MDVYILTVIEDSYIVDQEAFSECPTFPPHEAVTGYGTYTVELRQANINGGDSIPLHWNGVSKRWYNPHGVAVD